MPAVAFCCCCCLLLPCIGLLIGHCSATMIACSADLYSCPTRTCLAFLLGPPLMQTVPCPVLFWELQLATRVSVETALLHPRHVNPRIPCNALG